MQAAPLSVVTATDSNYVWGVLLLVGSLRRHGVNVPVDIAAHGLKESERSLLEQFPDVRVHDITHIDPPFYSCLKPLALLQSQAECAVWMDADCIVTGDVTRYLDAAPGKIRIRLRGEEEQRLLSRQMHGSEELVPGWILEQWRHDIGERDTPRYQTLASSCCFSVRRENRPMLERWYDDMTRLLVPGTDKRKAPTARACAYRADESVLNAILNFAHDVPKIEPYGLDRDEAAMLLHFVDAPKPWEGWTVGSRRHYEHVIDTAEWAAAHYDLLRLPAALRRRYRVPLIAYGVTASQLRAFARLVRHYYRDRISISK